MIISLAFNKMIIIGRPPIWSFITKFKYSKAALNEVSPDSLADLVKNSNVALSYSNSL